MPETVYFATNRKGTPTDVPTSFGKDFNQDGLACLRFGVAIVKGAKGKETVEVATQPETLVEKSGKLDAENSTLGSKQVFHALRVAMRESERDTVLYVHGYNVDFEEAIVSAARIAKNLRSVHGKGVNVVAFSWPSDGSLMPWLAYSSDRQDARASGPALARGFLKLFDFLRDLESDELCRQRVHLICHSMGNYVLRHGLQVVRGHCPGTLPRVFDQVLLMAPDEDDDAFEHEHKLRLLPQLCRRVNVYFNRGDAAMFVGDATKGHPDRLGDDGPRAPFAVPAKVTQIDCSDVVTGLVEHSYYLDCKPVVRDMKYVLLGLDPAAVPKRKFLDDRNRYVLRK